MVIIVMRVMTAGGDDDPITMPVRFLPGRRGLYENLLCYYQVCGWLGSEEEGGEGGRRRNGR